MGFRFLNLRTTWCVSAFFLLFCSAASSVLPAAESIFKTPHGVRRVIDGDTLELDTGERIRLIGINAPEYQPWKNHADSDQKEDQPPGHFDGRFLDL